MGQRERAPSVAELFFEKREADVLVRGTGR